MSLKIPTQSLFSWLLKFNIVWAVFLPIILAVILSSYEIQGLFIIKDIIFYASFLLLLFISKSRGLFLYTFMIFIFLVYLFLLTSIFFKLNSWIVYNLRQLISPILIIGFGYYIKITDEERITGVIRFLYKTVFWVVAIGLLFKLFGMWDYLSLINYFNLKGIPVDPRGVSYMFYEPAVFYTERLVSTVLDPVSLGHIIATPLILCYYSIAITGRKRKLLLLILFIGLILTFSKGAILQVVLALFFFNKRLSPLVRVIIPIAIVVFSLLVINIEGILIHLVGLKNAIIYMNLFGHGLGMVGNYAKMFADDLSVYSKFKISDTFIGSVIGQIGVVGFIFWASFFIPKVKYVIFGNRIFVGSIILLSQLIVAVMSENTLNFTSFIIPGIITGLLIKNKI
tara:strand:+ start:7585 stop:8775 length:1191 start_codon:yes stop_codon:yes gene_type:complete